LRTARPVNKNYRLLNILRNANVNKVGRPTSAIAEFLFCFVKVVWDEEEILQLAICDTRC